MNIKLSSVKTGIPSLIPMPAELELVDGNLELNHLQELCCMHSSLLHSAELLSATFEKFFDIQLPPKSESEHCQSGKNTISLELLDSETDESAYSLTINAEGICISSGHPTGVFYGVQTLIQLLEFSFIDQSHSLQWLNINDRARCRYRGLHLDVSRHFRAVDEVKHLLDLMAMHKMNRFHWHLVDDQGWRIEIKQYPRLTQVGGRRDATVIGHTLDRDAVTDATPHAGYYTQDQIKEIVAYAQERFITVIPEIDLPGHSSALLAAYPEYSCADTGKTAKVQTHFGIFDHVLCNREHSFDFLRDVLTEVAHLFPSDYIHIGGDEVHKTHWEQCQDCQSIIRQQQLAGTEELHGYFIGRVVKILKSLNKKAICWDDVLSADNLPSDITIMSWLGEEKADDALARGHDLIMTQSNLYFDFYQSMSIDEPFAIHGHSPLHKVYEYDPLKNDARILGAQANIWTEYIQTEEQLEYTVLPRMTALAEILWTPHSHQDWTNFKERLRQQFQRFDLLGLNASRGVYVPEFEVSQNDDGSFEVAILKEFPDLDIFYTLDNTRPDHHSLSYQSPLQITGRTVINACCVDTATSRCYGVNRIAVFPHQAINCPVKLSNGNGHEIRVEDSTLLTNGFTQQGQRFQHANWVVLEDTTELDLQIDLRAEKSISAVSIGFDGALGRKLYFPESIEVLTSIDGSQWQVQGRYAHNEASGRSGGKFSKTPARYVRIRFQNHAKIYSHEREAMIIPPLYIDECIVT